MNAITSYALLSKQITSALTGIDDIVLDGLTMNIALKDGTTRSLNFPAPADGVSITGASIDEDKHLIFTCSDGTLLDAGELPSGGSSEPGSSVLTEDLTTTTAVGGITNGKTYTAGTSLETIIRDMLVTI